MDARPIPYELRIGVSGHRTLPDPEGTAQAVRNLLDHLERVCRSAAEYPHGPAGAPRPFRGWLRGVITRTAVWPLLSIPGGVWHTPEERRTPLHWVVVSPLARGADRVVTRAVLERDNARLKVVTPFRIEDYRQDFKTPHDSREFDELLAHDDQPTELPNEYGPDDPADSEATRAEKQTRRNEGYFDVGRRVAENCEILIVVWNGEPASGRGGTGDIVRYAVELGRVVLWIDSKDPSKPAQLVVEAPRDDSAQAPEREDQALWYATRPLPERIDELCPAFYQLSAFNRDPLYDAARGRADFDARSTEFKSLAAPLLPDDVVGRLVYALFPNYIRADQLALSYQGLYVLSAIWISTLAVLSVAMVVVQTLFFKSHWSFAAAEIVAMLLALSLQQVNVTESWREKWLNDRHLAERLRISMFTVFFGPTGEAARRRDEALLPFYPGPGPWVAMVVERLVSPIRESLVVLPELPRLKRFVIDGLIGEQARWHRANAKRKGHNAHRLHAWALWTFRITLLMAALHLAHSLGHHPIEEWARESLAVWQQNLFSHAEHVITMLAIVLPAVGAALNAYNTLRDYERLATRSEHMSEILATLAYQAENAQSLRELSSVVRHSVEVMAAENEEWMASLRIGGDPSPA